MPRLRDVPVAIRKVGIKQLATDIWTQIGEDNVLTWASALAYSWLFALFPFLIFLLTLLPYVPETQKHQALDYIDNIIKQLPKETASTLYDQVDALLNQRQTGLMSLGLLLALWTASGGVSATMSALDECHDIKPFRPIYTQRPLAILLTIVVAALMLLVVALLPIGSLVLNWMWSRYEANIGSHLPPWMQTLRTTIDVTRWLLGLILLAIVLNVVYHFGSQVKRRFRFITPGAVFCIAAWVAMGLGFRWYIDAYAVGGYNKTYGAVGGIVILMFLFYLAATILLVGAEINSELDYVVLGVPHGTKDLRPAERARRQERREARKGRETEET